MKAIKSFVLLIILLAGCADKLEVEPVGQFLTSNYYKTEDQVYSALIAAYDPLGWSMAFGDWVSPVMYGEIRSDNANAGGDPSNNDQPAWQEIDDFRELNTTSVLYSIYRKYYVGVGRANLVIHQPQIESALVERYKAEAKFIRAFSHFELFRHFGPVPVITTVLEASQTDLERNTMTELFTSVTNDLEEAIEVLPTTLSDGEIGRASRGAALALLGKVYLYWADLDNDDPAKFDLAAQYLQQVVDMEQYELLDDYNMLWAPDVENPAESVFEIQHSNLWPSGWDWFEGIEGNGIVQLTGIRGLCDAHPDYAPGWGFLLPTADLNDHFLADDEYRRDAAIISVSELQQDIADAGASCPVVVDETQINTLDYEGYFQQKYANYKIYNGNNVNGGDPNLTKDPNTYVIRYADVLLMLAEALHRGSGSDAEAQTYIDMVRERAAGPGDNTGSFKTAQDLMDEQGWTLLEVIWYERRAELAGEGDRWYDLVRSGRAASNLFTGERAGNFSEQSLYVPISLEETNVATGLSTYPDTELFQ